MQSFDPGNASWPWMIGGAIVFSGLPAGLIGMGVAISYGDFLAALFSLLTFWLWGMVIAVLPAIAGAVMLKMWGRARGPMPPIIALAFGGLLGFVVVRFVINGNSLVVAMGIGGGVIGALGAMYAKDWYKSVF